MNHPSDRSTRLGFGGFVLRFSLFHPNSALAFVCLIDCLMSISQTVRTIKRTVFGLVCASHTHISPDPLTHPDPRLVSSLLSAALSLRRLRPGEWRLT